MIKTQKYTAANLAEAYIIQALLKYESIQATILGDNLTIAAGGLPADVFNVNLLIEETQFIKAMEIIKNYEERLKLSLDSKDVWKCNSCDKMNPCSFEICWSCQLAK